MSAEQTWNMQDPCPVQGGSPLELSFASSEETLALPGSPKGADPGHRYGYSAVTASASSVLFRT